jgi:hypothetical protein
MQPRGLHAIKPLRHSRDVGNPVLSPEHFFLWLASPVAGYRNAVTSFSPGVAMYPWLPWVNAPTNTNPVRVAALLPRRRHFHHTISLSRENDDPYFCILHLKLGVLHFLRHDRQGCLSHVISSAFISVHQRFLPSGQKDLLTTPQKSR